MSNQEAFPEPERDFHAITPSNANNNHDMDRGAMAQMYDLYCCYHRSKDLNITYMRGAWGPTVVRTAYSDDANTLWPAAIKKLERWVSQYFVHLNRLVNGKSDRSVCDELGRRFLIDVFDGPVFEDLKLDNLAAASQEDIKLFVEHFRAHQKEIIGEVDLNKLQNPRFFDFLVIDDDSLRSLANLPEEPLEPMMVSRGERRATYSQWWGAYCWLIDSEAVLRYQGVDNEENYNGVMKVRLDGIPDAWFERARKAWQNEPHIFGRQDEGNGNVYYVPS